MTPLAREAPQLASLAGPVSRDLDRLHARARDHARRGRRPSVVSFTVAAEDLDPVALFEGAAVLTRERALWSAPGEAMDLVALGAAGILETGAPGGGTGPASAAARGSHGPAADHGPGLDGHPAGGPAAGLFAGRDPVAGFAPVAGAVLSAAAAGLAEAWQALCEGALVDAPHGVWGTGPVLVGGFRFDPGAPVDPLWTGFPAARFVLPELLVTRIGGATWLTFNRVVVPDGAGSEAAGEGGPAWAFPGGIRLTVPPAATTAAGERGRRWLSLLAVAAAVRRRQGGWTPAGPGPSPLGPAASGDSPGAGAAAPQGSLPPGTAERQTPGPVRAEATPGREAWEAMVRAALEAIAAGELEKVVLARRLHLVAGAAFDPGTALRRLKARYPECFVFAVARDRAVFLGATPERLVRLRGGRLETAAVAGSTGRGDTPQADRALARALLESPKEREEHALVVRMLRETLAPVCRRLEVPDEPRVLTLANVQHLYTPIAGQVDGVTIPQLVGRLHPTPALGGWPREAALAFIRRWEGGSRGWYAGPLGWFDHRGEGEMAVAIRSGLVRGTEAWLFAGCGVVAGSDPEREWQETRLKLQPLAAALGVEAGAGEVERGD